jgi:ornithine cyclodeaminase/alanine dehydrogenase-like protein (mu-crystallin family)
MIVVSHDQVVANLSLDECIEAVERAFAARRADDMPRHPERSEGSQDAQLEILRRASPAQDDEIAHGPASLSLHVDGGAFHVKAAAIGRYFAAKVNGNFFTNPERGLPRIRGTLVLADATNGEPLAVMDSAWITILRTGAATAVAARHLARKDAKTLLVCGCGNQGRVSVDAIRRVRPIDRVLLFDHDRAAAERLAGEVGGEVVNELTDADIVVTCTPSRSAFLQRAAPGTFIAAVGADSSEKQEIAPALLAASAVVVDDLEQCASFGDLRYALDAGLMKREDVRATLAEVVRGKRVEGEVIVFDSTGTALQDVAAAAIVYERMTR